MANETSGYSRASQVGGWLIALVYLGHSALTAQLARSDRFGPLREVLRGWHYVLGATLLALVIWRLWNWRRDGGVPAPAGLGAGVWHWGRSLAVISYLLMFAAPFLGVLFAWADGLKIHLGPLPPFPSLMERSRPVWMFTGYFHSGMGFMLITLNAAALLTGLYTLLRYGRGLLRVMPPGYGAQVFGSAIITVYSFATFRSPAPGPRAVGIFLAIAGAIWAVGALLHRERSADPRPRRLGPFGRAVAPAFAVALLILGAYGPHALFKVTPWAMGTTLAAPAGVTSHLTPATRVVLPPETAYERQVKVETYKWCRFCHSVAKNGPHLVGPNLYLIFGQKAASAPNFAYTDAIVAAGKKGLVWDDATIAHYIADPQKNMPGTAMIVSSGPIPDPKVQQAIVNILKRETMQDAQAPAAPPQGPPAAPAPSP